VPARSRASRLGRPPPARGAEGEEAGPHVRRPVTQEVAPAGQDDVEQPRLRDAGPPPVGPHRLDGLRDGVGVALEEPDGVPGARQRQCGGEAGDARPDDHDARH
jgi:hypothetical protein